MSSAGTKVTNDPRAGNNINEAVGVVTSDSLAGQSLKDGGTFGAGNPKAAASKQPSASTTTNTTDTSGASKLAASSNSGTREGGQGGNPEMGRNLGKEAGFGPTYNTLNSTDVSRASGNDGNKVGGNTEHQRSQAGSGGNTGGAAQTSATGGVPSTASSGSTGVPVAPTASYSATVPEGALKPKGKNLTEGGFEGNEPNASFNNEIGTEDDPGRRAEAKMEASNAQTAGSAAGAVQGGKDTGTIYQNLNTDERV